MIVNKRNSLFSFFTSFGAGFYFVDLFLPTTSNTSLIYLLIFTLAFVVNMLLAIKEVKLTTTDYILAYTTVAGMCMMNWATHLPNM